MILIVMGVAGVGKSRIGSALADELRWKFFDADDYHGAANIARMAHSIPLTDDDRRPWLKKLHGLLESLAGTNGVLACSALTADFRSELTRGIPEAHFIFLTAPREILENRLASRKGHFFDPDLLQSQLDTLEQPQDAITIDTTGAPDAVVADLMHRLKAACLLTDQG